MAVDDAAKETPGSLDRPLSAALQTSLSRWTSNVKGIVVLIGALVGLVLAYYSFEKAFDLEPPWPAVLCTIALVIFVLVGFLPDYILQRKRYRQERWGISGEVNHPDYFRLTPYDSSDAETFSRPDGAKAAVERWIEEASSPLLYLSGFSGVGKSSLLDAGVLPALRNRNYIVVSARPHDAPLTNIAAALAKPGTVWQEPLAETGSLRTLLERAAKRVGRSGGRLLLVVDQFEEALILCTEEEKADLIAFLAGLVERPVPDLTVLLSLRTEYLNDLMELGLPPPAFGSQGNAFDVQPFTRAAAQTFLEGSKIKPGPDLLDSVLAEAAEIEDMPDKVRPIVLNMLGLVLASFRGALPKGVKAGELLSGYAERSLKATGDGAMAARVLRPLVTGIGTKRAQTLAEIANAAGVSVALARGLLLRLSLKGLVRPLPASEHGAERWEAAHDFVARLLQPLLRSWPQSTLDTVRTWGLPALVALYLPALAAAIWFYPEWRQNQMLEELREVGLVHGPPRQQGLTILYNGRPIEDVRRFWETMKHLTELEQPVVGLRIADSLLTSLEGLPVLPQLSSLDLSFTRFIKSLEGLPVLPQLSSLNLDVSEIESLEGLPVLPQLSSLNLRGNMRLKSLEGLPVLPQLSSLDLRGIPTASLTRMIDTDIEYIINTKNLNEIIVSSEEERVLRKTPASGIFKYCETRCL